MVLILVMKKTIVFGLIISFAAILIYATSEKKANLHFGTTQFVPSKIDFADEFAPLQIVDVKERFERELLINANLDASTLLIIKRANRFFGIIEPILKKNNVPDDFKYLAVIESALTNATSSSGAKGFWQFMTPTAKEKGLEISEFVDERYDLEKSTQAACDYLIDAKAKFGSWTLAAASYNAGMSGVSKQMELQKVDNYYDLLLNDETSRYVFRILALKAIMKNPEAYGFEVNAKELYENIPVQKLDIDSTIADLSVFAKGQGINYKILKIHNPWLRDKKLGNPNRKHYTVLIPTSGY